ncbi:Rrf2 family transcriptional regulator [Nioella sp.]|uniref:Rrf2 family transcriptional regulator n=1 Tax=Nioella sp. TaxID=1912091 RepID=UPI0035148755
MSRVLHALLHLAEMDHPATSQLIAQMLQTNSAVVRRTMAGLREAGIVTSVKGHGGGWTLQRPLDDVTLLDIYRALGEPLLFAIGIDSEQTTCVLARAANAATSAALQKAQSEFEKSLAGTTVSQIGQVLESRQGGH